jgi:putative membrane protein
MNRRRRGPAIFIDDDPELAAPAPEPAAAAPPPDDPDPEPEAAYAARTPAAARAVRMAARPRSGWSRLVWSAFGALVSLAVSIAAYDFVMGLIARNAVIATIAAVLGGVVLLGLIGFALREAAAMARLGKVDAMRRDAEAGLRDADRAAALRAVQALRALYAKRRDLDWGLAELKSREADLFEADSLITAAERNVLAPLDAQAEAAVGKAARTVAAATALVPMALIDVAAALWANLRMIREVAEIYDGRAGWLGSWRLLRAVAAHIVATGAVAIGEDMIGAAVGGGAVSKVSRRFGEGLINGALTCRVGAATIQVCRPLPFHSRPRPTGRGLTASALKGFFGK